jgi:hypothetical protein
MTADTEGWPVPSNWIDTQPAHLIDAAIDITQSDDPDAWKLFGGDQSPRYALWAYLTVSHADTRPFPAAMDVVDALRGPAGSAYYQAGLSPAEAARILGGDRGRRPSVQPRCNSRTPTHRFQPVEVDG